MTRRLGKGMRARRRGVVVLVLVLVLSLVNVALISGAAASSEDAHAGVLRVETVRAFYAAESGALVAAKGLTGGAAVPVQGSTINLAGYSIHFVQVREADGEAVVEGRSGFARRRLEIAVE